MSVSTMSVFTMLMSTMSMSIVYHGQERLRGFGGVGVGGGGWEKKVALKKEEWETERLRGLGGGRKRCN